MLLGLSVRSSGVAALFAPVLRGDRCNKDGEYLTPYNSRWTASFTGADTSRSAFFYGSIEIRPCCTYTPTRADGNPCKGQSTRLRPRRSNSILSKIVFPAAIFYNTESLVRKFLFGIHAPQPLVLLFIAGLLVAYAFGALVKWRGLSWCNCLVSVVPLLMLAFCCPESPVWLVQCGQLDKAEKSLRRLAPSDSDKVSIGR